MESINNCYTLFFESVSFKENLIIKVIEGKKGAKSEPLKIGDTDFGKAYKIHTDSVSRKYSIFFESPVAWQVVDESFTSADNSEEFESSGLLSILTKSKYLDYVNGAHGFYKDIIGQGKHYRLWTEDQVIEVISIEEPKVVVE